ncbi:MAG: PKD domain-containing protein [Methanoregula sp.]
MNGTRFNRAATGFLILFAIASWCMPVSASGTIPVASFIANIPSGTVPITVQFTDTSSNAPTSWIWSFGDGGSSTVQNPSHTYMNTGTYDVWLTASNDYGSNTVFQTGFITLKAATYAPASSFTASVTTGSAPLAVQFTDTSTHSPTAWYWSFGDGSIATVQNPSHTYTTTGTYTITLTTTNSAGGNTISQTQYITVTSPDSMPAALFSASVISGTSPLAVQFTDLSSGSPTAWAWSFGDGGISTQKNPYYIYTHEGTYTVRLTVTNSAGSTTQEQPEYIAVYSPPVTPVASFSSSVTSGTAPLTVRFSDTSFNDPTSWSWAFGDGSTSTQQNPTHIYASAGTYEVSLTASNTAGSDEQTSTIMVSALTITATATGTPLATPTFGMAAVTPSSTLVVDKTDTVVPAASPSPAMNSSTAELSPPDTTAIIVAVVLLATGGIALLFFFSRRQGGSGGSSRSRRRDL